MNKRPQARPIFLLRLQAMPGASIHRLRWTLKALLRKGLRCIQFTKNHPVRRHTARCRRLEHHIIRARESPDHELSTIKENTHCRSGTRAAEGQPCKAGSKAGTASVQAAGANAAR
jgi:hypothetical protein